MAPTHPPTRKPPAASARSRQPPLTDPTWVRVDELPARWNVAPMVAINALAKQLLDIYVHADGWTVSRGAWHLPWAGAGLQVDGTVSASPDPLPPDHPDAADPKAAVQARGGAVWQPGLFPQPVHGAVRLWPRDVARVLAAAKDDLRVGKAAGVTNVFILEVAGEPGEPPVCGRLEGPSPRVAWGNLIVRGEDLVALERQHKVKTQPWQDAVRAAVASRNLIDSLLDAAHPAHAPELALAWRAWLELVAGPVRNGSSPPHRQTLVKWLKVNDPSGSGERHARIATLLNLKPKSGRPKSR